MSSLDLTALTEVIYRAKNKVARELTGGLNAVMVNTDDVAISQDGLIESIQTSKPTLNTSITPSMTTPNGDAQTIGKSQMQLDKVANVMIPMTGPNARKLANIGQYPEAVEDMFSEAIRVMVNKVEQDIAAEVLLTASRAIGTAGTTPFGSDFNVLAELRKILVDNGSGENDLNVVVDTSAGTKLRQISGLWQANTSGSNEMLRRGTILDIYGLAIRESAGVQGHTKGTGTSYLSAAVEPIGETSISIDTGTGTIVAGDVITFTGDDNKYVVKTGFAGDGAGTIVLQGPGLRKALANNVAMTIGATYTGNYGLRKDAVEVALRPYEVPQGGDSAIDRMIVADDQSPLVFDVNTYAGYKQNMFELNMVYGIKNWKPEFVATLLG